MCLEGIQGILTLLVVQIVESVEVALQLADQRSQQFDQSGLIEAVGHDAAHGDRLTGIELDTVRAQHVHELNVVVIARIGAARDTRNRILLIQTHFLTYGIDKDYRVEVKLAGSEREVVWDAHEFKLQAQFGHFLFE